MVANAFEELAYPHLYCARQHQRNAVSRWLTYVDGVQTTLSIHRKVVQTYPPRTVLGCRQPCRRARESFTDLSRLLTIARLL